MVHLKTVDSIALPVYNGLPPGPELLPNALSGPPRKRVKLDTVDPICLTPLVDVSRSAIGGEGEGEEDEGEGSEKEDEGGEEEGGGGKRRKVGGGGGVGRRECVSGGLVSILVPSPKNSSSTDKCAPTPTPATQRKKRKV